MFGCLFFLVFALLLSVCVNVLHDFYLFTKFNDYALSKGSTFFHIHANTEKDYYCFQSNNNTSSKKSLVTFSSLIFTFENF